MRIGNEYVNAWLVSGRAVELHGSVGKYLLDYISEFFPWAFFSIDMESVNACAFSLSELSEDNFFSSKVSAILSGDSHLVFLYGEGESPVACEVEFAISNIDVAFWKAPGVRFMFGGHMSDGGFVPNLKHLIQYDGKDGVVFISQEDRDTHY